MKSLRNRYERLKRTMESPSQRALDPVSLVWRYRSRADREAAGFLVSCFAYGRRETIIRNCRDLLRRIGPSLSDSLRSGSTERFNRSFTGFVHRLNTASDAALLCGGLGKVLLSEGSLERLFSRCVSGQDDADWLAALREFTDVIRTAVAAESKRTGIPIGRSGYLLPVPGPGAAKRLNLFLKWMIRKDAMDPGPWSSRLGRLQNRLVMPVDVHIAAMARKNRIVSRGVPDWVFALQVTEYLRNVCPEDPLRFDFCLCHDGMERSRGNRK